MNIMGISYLLIAAIAFTFCVLVFLGKGIIISDVYVKASKETREAMDKKQLRLQSAVIFLALGMAALLNAGRFLLSIHWFSYLAIFVCVIGAAYTIHSEQTLKKLYKE